MYLVTFVRRVRELSLRLTHLFHWAHDIMGIISHCHASHNVCALIIIFAVLSCALYAGGACDGRADAYRFSGYVKSDVASAYISTSGGLSDTRPVSTHTLGLRQDLGGFGFIDGYIWSICALHDKQRDKHGQLFYWLEGAAHYGYDLPLWEGTLLQTKAGPYCGLPLDYVHEHNPSLGLSVAQRFDNPYVTPYWGGIWLCEPSHKGRVKAGLAKGFELRDDLTLSVYFQPTWMDHRRYRARYGSAIEEKTIMGGAVAFILFGVQLDWKFSDDLRFYAAVSQYDVVNRQARNSIKNGGHYYDKCDWPLLKVGAAFSF